MRDHPEISSFAHAVSEHAGARRAFKVAIVAPVHIQPSPRWIEALNAHSQTATIIIVDDSNGKVQLPENWDVYGYDRQKEEMGEELYAQFERFHKSSACKNFGTWLAYNKGFDPVIVIDSDCIVPPDFVSMHMEAMLRTSDGWTNPLDGTGYYSRGFPMYEREIPVVAHMGLWENELDLYGTDRVGKVNIPKVPSSLKRQVPSGHFPLSGMNVCFRRQAIPFMLFLPNFSWGTARFTRHDDIWGGYIFQKIARHQTAALSFGAPMVFHDTVVIPEEDAADEEAMIAHEKAFYAAVDDAFGDFTYNLNAWTGLPRFDYFDELAKAFQSIVNADELDAPPAGFEFVFADLIPALRFWSDAFRERVI